MESVLAEVEKNKLDVHIDVVEVFHLLHVVLGVGQENIFFVEFVQDLRYELLLIDRLESVDFFFNLLVIFLPVDLENGLVLAHLRWGLLGFLQAHWLDSEFIPYLFYSQPIFLEEVFVWHGVLSFGFFVFLGPKLLYLLEYRFGDLLGWDTVPVLEVRLQVFLILQNLAG